MRNPRLIQTPADIREAVSSIEVMRDPDGGERFKYKLHPKLAALDLIAKLRGLVTVVSRLAEAHLAKVEMDIDEMCLTASRIGRARVSQLFAPRVNGDDWTLLHPTELPDDVSEAVQSIEVHRDPDGGEHFKYKMHPKLQALDPPSCVVWLPRRPSSTWS